MSKMKRSLSVLLAVMLLAAVMCVPAGAEFNKNALAEGVYQLNVIHSAKIPELDDATFTIWLSAICFAAGDSENGNTYVMTDADLAKNDRLFDTLGDKFIEYFYSKGQTVEKSELPDKVEITYTAFYAVYNGNHVALTPVDQYSSRDIMLFETESPLPTAKYSYVYADEAKADSLIHAYSLSGTDVDGIVVGSDDAYITNWSLTALDGKITVPADIQDGSTARTYTSIPQSRSAQGSPVFDDNGNIIGLYTWSDSYDGTAAVTSSAMMNILDGVSINYDVAKSAATGVKSSDITIYIYIAAVAVIVLVAALFILRARRRRMEAEEFSRSMESKKKKSAPVRTDVPPVPVNSDTQIRRPEVSSRPETVKKPNAPVNPVPASSSPAVPASQASANPAAEHTVTLTVLGGDLRGYSKVIDQPLVLGRDPEKCNVVFPADLTCVSRVHCTVTYNKQSGRILLEDLNSSNGTYFPSGSRIIPGRLYALRSGDRFYLGIPENTVEVRMK